MCDWIITWKDYIPMGKWKNDFSQKLEIWLIQTVHEYKLNGPLQNF